MTNAPINDWLKQANQVASSGELLNITGPAVKLRKPVAALVTAADFPIDPHRLTGAQAGSFYMACNTAGLIPPGSGDGLDLSIGATLEFAIQVLGVRHIIVMMSPNCGLLNCLLDEDAEGISSIVEGRYLPNWTQMIGSAMSRIGDTNLTAENRLRLCSQELTRISFENLMTYPWVLDRVFNGAVELHGWYYDEVGQIFSWFDPATDEFVTN